MKKIIITMLVFSVVLQTISLAVVIYYHTLPVQTPLTIKASNEGAVSLTIVSRPPSPEEPSGGTGGGAGGTTKAFNFTLHPEELNIFVGAGKTIEKEITITNHELNILNFAVIISGIEEFAAVNEKKFSLASGESKRIILALKAGDAGVYTGRVSFTSGSTRKDVLVILNVYSGKLLFDSSLTIPDAFKRIPVGKNLRAFISLTQIGDAQDVDVTINYIIKDFYGNTFNKETETFRVRESKSYVKEFSTRRLVEGEYVAAIEIVYPDGFATASSHFTIYRRTFAFYIIILLVLLLLSIIVLFYSIKKYREAKTLISKKAKKGGK